MNEYSLRLSKPHCDACHRPKGMTTEEFRASFPENRILKQGEILGELSLLERLSQALAARQKVEVEDEI